MTLIARMEGDTIAEYPLTLADLRERHPLISWPEEPTAEAFADTEFDGAQYVLVEETPPPAVAFGEIPVPAALPEKVGDSWRRAWTVESFDLADAKAELRAKARGILEERVERLSSVEHELFGELGRLLAAQDAGDTIVPANYPLVQAIAAARGITFTNAAAFANTFRAAWLNRADNFVGKYLDVNERIQNASTTAAAYAIFLELDAIP